MDNLPPSGSTWLLWLSAAVSFLTGVFWLTRWWTRIAEQPPSGTLFPRAD